MKPNTPIYVSVDIEADGPIPGKNSMLAIGAAAFCPGIAHPIDTFSVNLETLPAPAEPDPDTMDWWAERPEDWDFTRTETKTPLVAMTLFDHWVQQLPGTPIFVGYPVSYDMMWTHWYFLAFLGKDPFGYQGLDIKTLASATLGIPYHEVSKNHFPVRWTANAPPHKHHALDDAIHQGVILINILDQLRNR